MSEADWTFFSDGLPDTDVLRGVSRGYSPPPGGGSNVFGFNSRTNTAGTVAKAGNASNFHPIAAGSGVSITGALLRNGDQYGTVMLFGALDADSVLGSGYLLGLSDNEEPSRILLVKGSPSDGLASDHPGVLATSATTVAKGTWVHLRLDIIVQPHGDVHLQVKQNVLTGGGSVATPSWVDISGMPEFIDDVNAINTGSPPYKDGGYAGVAFRTDSINRYALVDHVTIGRQL